MKNIKVPSLLSTIIVSVFCACCFISVGFAWQLVLVENDNIDWKNIFVHDNVAAIISDIDTSNWLTYKNEEYGFEFDYPSDWKVSFIDETRSVVALSSPNYAPIKRENTIYDGELYVHTIPNKNNLEVETLFNTFDDNSGVVFSNHAHEVLKVGNNSIVLFDAFKEPSDADFYTKEGILIKDHYIIVVSYLFKKPDTNDERIFTNILTNLRNIEH